MKKHNRKIIYFAGFVGSIPLALTSYINSSFLETYFDQYSVGIIYIIASLLTIVAMVQMPRVLTYIGNRMAAILFCILNFAAFLMLAFGGENWMIVAAFVLYFITNTAFFASLDIFIEDFSKRSDIGGVRGLYLMAINSAWIVAQMISGTIIAKSSFQGIYMLAALIMMLVSFIFILFLRDFKDPKYTMVPIRKTIVSFLKNRNLTRIYFINLILRFFFAWMVIYTPIYLHEYLGFGWDKIGIIFTIMLLPFMLLDFVLGKLSDKMGEKKILILGFLISGIFTLAIPLISVPTLYVWAGILFMTRVGAACIEVMSESYFFKSEKEEDADMISFFRNTMPVSYIIAPLCAIPILLFVPSFEYLFFVLGAVMFLGMFLTLRLKDIK
jgi:MFS family permease